MLGSGEAISIRDLALMVEALIGANSESLLDIGTMEPRVEESGGYFFDMSESFEFLSWSPKVSMHDGLMETIGYARNTTNA